MLHDERRLNYLFQRFIVHFWGVASLKPLLAWSGLVFGRLPGRTHKKLLIENHFLSHFTAKQKRVALKIGKKRVFFFLK
jgi:hypothetical protein